MGQSSWEERMATWRVGADLFGLSEPSVRPGRCW